MKEDESQIEAMLQIRERLEHLRVIANQPEYKYYLQPKLIVLILAVLLGGIIVWVIGPKISSISVIPILVYILIVQGISCRTENARLTEQLNALREMIELEEIRKANQRVDLTR